MKVIAPEEMRSLEARYMEDSGTSAALLMDRAAEGLKAAAIKLAQRENWPPRGTEIPETLPPLIGIDSIIFCGPGANGGDGWALAWRLYDAGCDVLAITRDLPAPGTPAYMNFQKCMKRGRAIRILDLKGKGLDECEDGETLVRYVISVCGAAQLKVQLCVDALFGTGLNRPLKGIYRGFARMMAHIAQSGARVLAVDIPSGLNGLTGEDGGACPADMTVTFQHVKRGLLLKRGQDIAGALRVYDIGIPETYAPEGAPNYLTPDEAVFPRRRHDSHKGTYGHLLIIAGSKAYAGAEVLCVRAALRSGAGLITAACVSANRALLLSAAPSAMALDVGDVGEFSISTLESISEALNHCSAIAIGPGLTRAAAPEIIAAALKSGLPAVLDADALNIISENPELLNLLNRAHVLTPHPGEMARLLKRPLGAPDADARELAQAHGCTVLLKGSVTCVAGAGELYMMNPGCAGMACGGSGDALTGVLGALLAQGLNPLWAANYAALLHGRAGVRAQARLGEISMNASDIIDELPGAFMAAQARRFESEAL